MKFALYDQTGRIHATGECPDGMEHLQALPGTSVFLGHANPWDSIHPVTGQLIPGTPPQATYREKRNYPPIAAQLDALWHAMDAGEIPKATLFYNMIKKAKDEHPDPEGLKDLEL